jgi:hypothetical protein
MKIVGDVITRSVILMTLELSFMIIMCLFYRQQAAVASGGSFCLLSSEIQDKISIV